MIKIGIVVPYRELQELIEETLDEYSNKDISFQTLHVVGLGVGLTKTLKVDCDVMIARGITAAALKQYREEIPIIEIPVTGYDVIRAVDECKKKFNPKKIAIMGSVNMIYGAQSLKDILGVDVECYIVNNDNDAKRSITEALETGADAVIGGLMMSQIASAHGINSILIKSGKEAVRQALEEAIRTALISQQEREKVEQFKTIMNYAHEGIIATDKDGYITVFNRTAQKITKLNDQMTVGKHIKNILPQNELTKVLKRGEEELGLIEKIGTIMVATNRVPIKVKDKVVGAVATFQDVTKIQELEGQIRKKLHAKGLTAKYTFSDIIGSSKEIRETLEVAEKFSKVDSNILLIGETGTGKELLAQSIHNSSNRRVGPFVAINCAALPENLLESELFGYVEGAFSGAVKGGKIGLFELAHKGTIFLDEIGEISLGLQGKLLRVLQEKEIRRLGDDKIIPIDVRVISATNKNLREMVSEGTFRQDLLYRLDVLKINVPPLRKRKEDILLLVDHFLKLYNKKFNKNIQNINPQAQKLLLEYPWEGNVRELNNICERLAVLTVGEEITINNVEKAIGIEETEHKEQEKFLTKENDTGILPQSISEIEKGAILSALEKANNNKAEAARILGISRTTLWRKLKEFNI